MNEYIDGLSGRNFFKGVEVGILENTFYKLMSVGEYTAAEAISKLLFEITEENGEPWHLFGFCSGDKTAGAALVADPEIKYPEEMDANCNLGERLLNEGKLEEAMTYFKKNQALMDRTYFNIGLTLYRMNKPREALKYLLKAAVLAPDHPECFNVLGQAYGELGNVKKAESCLHRALEIDPKYATGYYDLGLILAKQRTRDAEAKGLFIKAVELDPDMAWSYYSIACIDALEGKKDEALKNLEVALEKGLKDKAHIEKDSDLDSLRKDRKYRYLMEKYLGKEREEQRRA
jgi:tetratricopeptide (TPR) repeat protein